MRKNLIFIVLIIILFDYSACKKQNFIIEGKILTDYSSGLQNVIIQFSFIDKKNNEHQYRISPKKDGTYRLSLRLKGVFILYTSLVGYPHEEWAEKPFFSHQSEFYQIDTTQPGIFHLSKMYITKPNRIVSPVAGSTLSRNDTLIWKPNNLAEYFRVSFARIDKEGQETIVLSIYQITSYSIRMADISGIPVISGKKPFKEVSVLARFKRKTGEFSSGKYRVYISGYVNVANEGKEITVTQLDPKDKTYFYVGFSPNS